MPQSRPRRLSRLAATLALLALPGFWRPASAAAPAGCSLAEPQPLAVLPSQVPLDEYERLLYRFLLERRLYFIASRLELDDATIKDWRLPVAAAGQTLDGQPCAARAAASGSS